MGLSVPFYNYVIDTHHTREKEIAPHKYYPPCVDRPLVTTMPTSVEMIDPPSRRGGS
jgi:hypothetical protein